MGRSRGGLFGFALLLAAAVLPGAARADAAKDCANKSGPEAIRACTEAIQHNPHDAKSYNNRGVEYLNAGVIDRAIADYDLAIRLDPKYAFAYNGRGNAWNG
jgi:tetratricopeptide (TPR) repeat protein